MRGYNSKEPLTPVTLVSLATPLVLILLFYGLRGNTTVLLWWTEGCLPTLAHALGKVSALFPFALGEVFLILLIAYLIPFLGIRIYLRICQGKPLFTRRHIYAFLGLLLWLWAGMSWLWNPLYYIPSFATRSGLEVQPYPTEDLAELTAFFAEGAQKYSTQVPRNEDLSFAGERRDYFADALTLYEALEVEFPFLATESVKPKALSLSYLQSLFGFTGVYNPFTGEANINVHTPAVLHPATIAHEMAHQRLIAPELEANFLAIAACLQSDEPVFLYSGYLFGLIQLSNALHAVDNASWQAIVAEYFNPELAKDWETNYQYWKTFESPVEDVAKDVYDGFLKSNDQSLGIRSYGACVDLLMAYYKDEIH